MNRLELLLLCSVCAMVFVLELVALLKGIDGIRLGLAVGVLGVAVGYLGKSLMSDLKH